MALMRLHDIGPVRSPYDFPAEMLAKFHCHTAASLALKAIKAFIWVME